MSFWDNPKNWPGTDSWPAEPGGIVQGTITRMAIKQSRYGRAQLVVELDSDGIVRWCNSRLWRTFGDARIEPGDSVRVTRGPDEDRGGEKPATTWRVERLQPAPAAGRPTSWGAAAPATPQPQPGPTW